MNVTLLDDETLFVAGLDSFLVELLRQLPAAATLAEDDPALGRFFPEAAEESEEKVNEDWREYVAPELRRLFESAVETVSGDLAHIVCLANDDGIEKFGFPLPLNHSDAWLNGLNQARIALAERHRATEADLEARFPLLVRNDRDFALLQINFYGLLQELIIEVVSRE